MGYGTPYENESDFEHNHDFGYPHPKWENPTSHGFDTNTEYHGNGLSRKTIIINVICIVIVILITLGLIYLCKKCCRCCKKKDSTKFEDDKEEGILINFLIGTTLFIVEIRVRYEIWLDVHQFCSC